jgi:hypothetical protein
MRIIHSFVSEKCSEDKFKIQMCYFILSCLYAKENGFYIVLHCDNKTADFLSIAPYDEIITDLEGIKWPANDKIFAWGKFEAMKNEPLGAIHIDGDVFLKSPKLKELLKFDKYDCIVQNLEIPGVYYGVSNHYQWDYNSQCFKDCIYPLWAKRECRSMYNCGIIGFNNQDLKDEYFKTYHNMVNQYNNTGINIISVPDLIIEQQFLKDLTDYKKYKVKTLLNHKDVYSHADDIGYQHVLGQIKPKVLDKVLLLIKKHNIEIYNKLMKKL